MIAECTYDDDVWSVECATNSQLTLLNIRAAEYNSSKSSMNLRYVCCDNIRRRLLIRVKREAGGGMSLMVSACG